ncbi:Nuclear transcription factor Y subunit C-9 [Acorus calamus]|uniref:Nuclear transcription factor Y subunit C-9 n=1 Tax=Acorus calamus TaxID=4465 RepID=A0AAV9CL85_ACOCL|nr:Nuclear transcription factor Y subunit C-9 [Acorus calamus]
MSDVEDRHCQKFDRNQSNLPRPYGSGGPCQVPSKPNGCLHRHDPIRHGWRLPSPTLVAIPIVIVVVAAAGEKQQQLHVFWAEQYVEIEVTTDFKNHSLRPARIKKIVKSRGEKNK